MASQRSTRCDDDRRAKSSVPWWQIAHPVFSRVLIAQHRPRFRRGRHHQEGLIAASTARRYCRRSIARVAIGIAFPWDRSGDQRPATSHTEHRHAPKAALTPPTSPTTGTPPLRVTPTPPSHHHFLSAEPPSARHNRSSHHHAYYLAHHGATVGQRMPWKVC